MLNQFSRTELLLGHDAMEKLAGCRVAVFGIGGVGGYTVEALARSGVGALDLIDDDRVCLTNINRQLLALRTTVGQYKVDVAAERVRAINPNCTVTTHKCFYLPETKAQFDFTQYDYVVDAIDTVSGKLALVEQAKAAGTPIICAMGAGNKVDPTAFRVADIYETSVCPLARVMRVQCRKRGIKKLKVVYSQEKPLRPVEDAAISCRNHCNLPARHGPQMYRPPRHPGSTAFVPPVDGIDHRRRGRKRISWARSPQHRQGLTFEHGVITCKIMSIWPRIRLHRCGAAARGRSGRRPGYRCFCEENLCGKL